MVQLLNDYWGITVPINGLRLTQQLGFHLILYYDDTGPWKRDIGFPFENFGLAPTLSEEQAAQIVDRWKYANSGDSDYKNYHTGMFTKTTAKESLYTLLQSKGLAPEITLIIKKKP
jgi:hypothetical protein